MSEASESWGSGESAGKQPRSPVLHNQIVCLPPAHTTQAATQAATVLVDMEPAAANNQPRTSQPPGQFNLSGIGRSAFTAVPPTSGLYPDLALFSQFNHLFPQGSAGGIDPSVLSLLGQQQQQQAQQQQQQAQQQQQQASAGQTEAARASGARGKPKAGDNKTSSAYASRHQAAEQRRRTRINDRLDRLRQVVPHAERANTAAFLEEVIAFISTLKQRVVELEAGLPASEKTVQPTVASADPGSSLVVRGQSPQTNPADSDALLSASYASLPDSSVAVANAIKLAQPVSEPTLPASTEKEALEMASKRPKLDNGGPMSALL